MFVLNAFLRTLGMKDTLLDQQGYPRTTKMALGTHGKIHNWTEPFSKSRISEEKFIQSHKPSTLKWDNISWSSSSSPFATSVSQDSSSGVDFYRNPSPGISVSPWACSSFYWHQTKRIALDQSHCFLQPLWKKDNTHFHFPNLSESQ